MEDRCVMCGAVIPEGTMVCTGCMSQTSEDMKIRKREFEMLHNRISDQDRELGEHCGHVAVLARKAALSICPEDAGKVYCAALVHDIGKLFINPGVISKPADLTMEERFFVDMHSVMGYAYLKSRRFREDICSMVLLHHGYHKEKFGFTDIPISCIGADIIRACDVFDAVTTDRPYHKAESAGKAIAVLRSQDEPIPDMVIREVAKII